MRKRFIEKIELEQEETEETEEREELKRILIIGSGFFSEKIHSETINLFDVKQFSPEELILTKLQRERKQKYNINILLSKLGDWIPQLIVVEDCGIFINNFTPILVFYYHNNIEYPPMVDYPSLAFFLQQSEIDFYNDKFGIWMSQVQYKERLEGENWDIIKKWYDQIIWYQDQNKKKE